MDHCTWQWMGGIIEWILQFGFGWVWVMSVKKSSLWRLCWLLCPWFGGVRNENESFVEWGFVMYSNILPLSPLSWDTTYLERPDIPVRNSPYKTHYRLWHSDLSEFTRWHQNRVKMWSLYPGGLYLQVVFRIRFDCMLDILYVVVTLNRHKRV